MHQQGWLQLPRVGVLCLGNSNGSGCSILPWESENSCPRALCFILLKAAASWRMLKELSVVMTKPSGKIKARHGESCELTSGAQIPVLHAGFAQN